MSRTRLIVLVLAALVFVAMLILDTTGLLQLAAMEVARLPWYVTLGGAALFAGAVVVDRRRHRPAIRTGTRKPSRQGSRKPARAKTKAETPAARRTRSATPATKPATRRPRQKPKPAQ